ncbi:hypothetical protein GOBAR_DD33992 [Gossypium barbadense]|nr:hypothetical protein GOBAR_DD33992 [Gossypium barbadense]
MVKTRNFMEGDSTLATKVVWDDELTLIFCELCINEVNADNRLTTHLNSKGWENVIALFQAKTQKNYGKPQLKNKWDTLKKEWRLWREFFKESKSIGWCPSKKTVDATEEWWAKKIQENLDFKGFKKKGIEPQLNELMWQMCGGIVATGENAWAPSSSVLPSGVPIGDDTPNEGFGDSDEHSNENEGIPPNEVMDEFNNMYNSFYMNYDIPELSEEAQRRIATIVTQVEHNNYHEEEEYVLSSVLRIKFKCNRAISTTVSRIFTDMLLIFARMGIDMIKPTEGQFEEVPNHIRPDTRYWPHFKDCIGAIDGTHIKACISPSCQIPYIKRKEKYYLVDLGYPQMASFLSPYRGNDIIYLIFVERYSKLFIQQASLIVISTMVFHNYIRRHAWSNDEDFREFENIPDIPVSSSQFDRGESSFSNKESDLEITMLKETIATSLMNPYL